MKYLKNEIKLGLKYMRVIFSTSDMIIMAKYYNAFLKQKGSSYPIFDNVVKLEKISYINVSDIDSNEIIIKMLSPLIVRKHEDNNKDTYLTFNDADFEKVLKENLLKTYSNLSVDISEFKIEPVKASKTVTNILRGTASASLGIFKLTGSVKLLNLLLQSGLGSRRGLGNGMFTVLG